LIFRSGKAGVKAGFFVLGLLDDQYFWPLQDQDF